jgi:hypothetical protein
MEASNIYSLLETFSTCVSASFGVVLVEMSDLVLGNYHSFGLL